MDIAAFHTTEAILNKLRKFHILPSLIPRGCTGLVQPLDTTTNKPFKAFLRDETDDYIDKAASDNILGITKNLNPDKWTVNDKRIMVTYVVAEAWSKFVSQ